MSERKLLPSDDRRIHMVCVLELQSTLQVIVEATYVAPSGKETGKVEPTQEIIV